VATSTTFFENGVDVEYFDPSIGLPSPYAADVPVMVFTGAMDYWANVDAVVWFADYVLPLIRAEVANAEFYIVGSRPSDVVKALGARPGITVTGSVPDVRPYVAHGRFAVAPLRIARGIQNKVLEALAMAKPVLATSMAAEGIRFDQTFSVPVADEPADFAAAAINWLRCSDLTAIGAAARQFVTQHYHWDSNLARVGRLLEGEPLI
jgi:sugar transferase (PEP-CTERM/EpsH1 system associated)